MNDENFYFASQATNKRWQGMRNANQVNSDLKCFYILRYDRNANEKYWNNKTNTENLFNSYFVELVAICWNRVTEKLQVAVV